jgi:hypothetical protein
MLCIAINFVFAFWNGNNSIVNVDPYVMYRMFMNRLYR